MARHDPIRRRSGRSRERRPFGDLIAGPADPRVPNASMTSVSRSRRVGITDEQAQAWISEQQQLGERAEFYFASTQLCFTATTPRS